MIVAPVMTVTYLCAACHQFAVISPLDLDGLDSGTTLTCPRCGGLTVVDLDTPEVRAERYKKVAEYDRLAAEQRDYARGKT